MIFFLISGSAISAAYQWPDNQPNDCPFPESTEITKIVFTGNYANYTGADTWFPMWAADGNCYSPFTDGFAYEYPSFGHYTNFLEYLDNINHRTGQAVMVGDDPKSLKIKVLGSMSTNYDNFYPCASVIADGVWYYGYYDAFNETGYFAGWRYSTDFNHFAEEQDYPWTNEYWTCAYDVSEASRYFDCGLDSQTEPGHIALNHDDVYTPEIGYGWDAPLSGDIDRGTNVKTTRDFSTCDSDRTFHIDVENGLYRVMLFMGDKGDVAHDKMAVSAEGELKNDNLNTAANDFNAATANEMTYMEFDVVVEDGQLNLLFQDKGGDDPNWVVNAIYVRPANDDNFFNEKGKAKFRVPRAVVFGQDNCLSPDDKIYLVSHGYSGGSSGTNNWANGDAVYLCRVDEGIENVTDPAKYEFWTGTCWSSSVEDAGPLLEWKDNLGGATITYNPGLKKYILVVHHNDKTGGAPEHRTIFMESDKITGPYKTIHYMTNWGPGSYFGNIPAKWISKDGKTAWLVIAANCWQQPANPPQCVYACSMHEFKFVTAEDEHLYDDIKNNVYKVHLLETKKFTGADPGEGLDLEGTFSYAINLGAASGTTKVQGVTFTSNATPGFEYSGLVQNGPWGKSPEYGDSSNDDGLESIMQTAYISQSNVATLNFNVTPAQLYKVQMLISENWYDSIAKSQRVFDILIDNVVIMKNIDLCDIVGSDAKTSGMVVSFYVKAPESKTLNIGIRGAGGGDAAFGFIQAVTLEKISDGTDDIILQDVVTM